MSLIEEALRKIKQPTRANNPPVTEKPRTIIERKPAIKNTVSSPPKQKIVPQEAKQVHSWSPTPSTPRPTQTTPSPTSQNALIIVTVASLTLTVILVVGVSFWLGHTLGDRAPTSPTTPLLTTTSTTPNPKSINSPPQINKLMPKALSPIQSSPIAAQVAPQTELIMTGVVVGAGEPFAMINDKIVSVGEVVGGMTVIEIQAGSVLLENGSGETKYIRVPR